MEINQCDKLEFGVQTPIWKKEALPLGGFPKAAAAGWVSPSYRSHPQYSDKHPKL